MPHSLRRTDRALDEARTQALLEEGQYGVLCLASDEDGAIGGYGVPVNYAMIDGAPYFHCATEGRKLDCLRAHDRVSFCVVAQQHFPLPERFSYAYRSVIVEGRAEVVESPLREEALRALVRRFAAGYEAQAEEAIARNTLNTAVVRIVPERITGKGNPA